MAHFKIQVYTTKEEKKSIQIAALNEDKSASDFCKDIILDYLKSKGNKEFFINALRKGGK